MSVINFQEYGHGRQSLGGEPLVFHCNHYNFWLQNTLLLNPKLGMAQVIHDAAASVAASLLGGLGTPEQSAEERAEIAGMVFSHLGFGTVDFSATGKDGGEVVFHTSHYGLATQAAARVDLGVPQTYFDAGFAAAAVAFIHNMDASEWVGNITACQFQGAPKGRVQVGRRQSGEWYGHVDHRAHAPQCPDWVPHHVDEPAILEALSGLPLHGDEEGLIPRFGVVLTRHMATFYNRISFEFTHRMASTGLADAADTLLVDAGYQCAFNTFGGMMTSPEWDAVIKPYCRSKEDAARGMVAAINTLGWGIWRVQDVNESRLVVHIYDDYESCGYLDMYGKSERPVAHLHQGAATGLMNLVYVGDIESKPAITPEYYTQVFDSERSFKGQQTKCFAQGDAYTEVLVTR